MTAFQKHLICALSIVLMIGAVPFQVAGEEPPSTSAEDIEAEVMVNPQDGVFFSPEALGNPTGLTTAAAACFPKPAPKTTFNRGESVWFNVYWTDTVEADQQNIYNVTMGVQATSLLVIFGPQDVDIDTGTAAPGTLLEFCVRVQRSVPPTAPSGSFPWGARVIKRQDNTQFQQRLNTITVQAPRQ
jgi:hypothetical protein